MSALKRVGYISVHGCGVFRLFLSGPCKAFYKIVWKAPHFFVYTNTRPEPPETDTDMDVSLLRLLTYNVLKDNYPTRLSAREIAEIIGVITGGNVKREHVHYALREFSRHNRHFAWFPSYSPHRIYYSIYLLNPPYDEEQ